MQVWLEAGGADITNVFGGYALDFEADEFVNVWLEAGGFDFANVVGGDALDFESDESVGGKVGEADGGEAINIGGAFGLFWSLGRGCLERRKLSLGGEKFGIVGGVTLRHCGNLALQLFRAPKSL